jgi:site-specific DNA-methyltransferase (adenine-specific)
MALAMIDVGFDLSPGLCLEAWMTSTGFPKYLDTSKAIDQQLGKTEERPVIGYVKGVVAEDSLGYGGIARGVVGAKQAATMIPVTAPATPEAAEFDGYATALKPCWEPFLVGVRP